jgi:hypothetical protein
MQFLSAFFWGFLLVNMAAYVISSMQGATYNFATASIFSLVFTVLVFLIGALIPNDPVDHH